MSWVDCASGSGRFEDEVYSPAHRCGLGFDRVAGGHYLSIPVSNRLTDYEEYYRLTPAEYARFRGDPDAASAFADLCRRRKADERLILPPGTDRGAG
jgi:hypothetical protein